jgi:hypothetical protein
MEEVTLQNISRLNRNDLEMELSMRGMISAPDADTEALRSTLEEQLLVESID